MVQRYAVVTGAIGPTVSGGDYVKYEDYADLKADNAHLAKQLLSCENANESTVTAALRKRIADLEAQLADAHRCVEKLESIEKQSRAIVADYRFVIEHTGALKGDVFRSIELLGEMLDEA